MLGSVFNRPRPDSGTGIVLAFCGVVASFVVAGVVAYLNTTSIRRNSEAVTHTYEILASVQTVLSLAKDAETGQRGFVITGDGRYLDPYHQAVEQLYVQLDALHKLTDDQPEQQMVVSLIRASIEAKLAELTETIALRRDQGFEAARNIVVTDRGKAAMDSIRTHIKEMEQGEREIRKTRIDEMDRAYATAIFTGVLTGVLGVLLSIAVAYLLARAARLHFHQNWVQVGAL